MLILDKNSRDIIDGDLRMAQDTLTEAYEMIGKTESIKFKRIAELILKANSFILPTRNLLIEDRNRQMKEEEQDNWICPNAGGCQVEGCDEENCIEAVKKGYQEND